MDYNEYFGFDQDDFRPCELTGGPGVDIHHIFGRILNEQMRANGIEDPEDVENKMCLSRKAHDYFGNKTQYNQWIFDIHIGYMDTQTPLHAQESYDPIYIEFVMTLDWGN